MKAKRSFREKTNRLWVACYECTRGGNGLAECSGGWEIKRWNKQGCFLGTLLPKFQGVLTPPRLENRVV